MSEAEAQGGIPGEPSIAEKTRQLIKEGRAKGKAQGKAEAAAAGVESAVEGSSDAELADKEKRRNVLLEQHKRLNPDITDSQREAILTAHGRIEDILAAKAEAGFDSNDITKLVGELTSVGLRRDIEDVDGLLMGYNIPMEQLEAVKAQLPLKSPEENKKMSPRDAAVKGKVAETLKGKILSTEKKMQGELDEAIGKANLAGDHDKVKELTKRKGKTAGFGERLKQIFSDKETGKEWATRIGTGLYWAFILMFLFIIWEMNAFNKMGRSNSR